MKKNKTIIITIVTLIVIVLLGIIIFNVYSSQNKEESIEIDPIETTRFDILKKAILSSDYFKDSSVIANESKEVASIDGKYDVAIKSGYYSMTIKDEKQEQYYCEIVDAVEQSLGGTAGKSIETCQMTLDGSINIGGISAEIYDSYKILTVNSEELASLYDSTSMREFGELISVDEINYNIQKDKYLLTSMSTGFTKEAKMYNVCGHIYNSYAKANDELLFTIYDANKNYIDQKTYTYKNDTKKYLSFCIEYEMEIDKVKFFSIGFADVGD